MPLNDLRESLDPPTLVLPVGGAEFVVAPCMADVWLRLQEIANRTPDERDEAPVSDMDLFKMSLGAELLAEMLEKVTGPELRIAGVTAWYWQLGNHELAEAYFNSGGKAPAASDSTQTPTPPETRTDAATTTRRRDSGTTTSTPTKSASSAKD